MDKGKGIVVEEIEKGTVEIANLPNWLAPLIIVAMEFHTPNLRKHATTMEEVQYAMMQNLLSVITLPLCLFYPFKLPTSTELCFIPSAGMLFYYSIR